MAASGWAIWKGLRISSDSAVQRISWRNSLVRIGEFEKDF
jgi:hypothetical protein